MKVENPAAFNLIIQDEIYLLAADRDFYNTPTTPTPEAPMVETQPLNFNYLGGNKKNFLVVVHYPDVEFIAEAHLTALQNIFKRMELTLDDVAIFNRAKYQDIAFEQLMDFFSPKKLLLLGQRALPEGIGLLSLNQPKPMYGCNTLFSFSFDEMMDNTEHKKAFWEQMKQL